MATKPSAQDHEHVNKAITLTQVEAFRDRQVSTLSGGERARVWLAMCLAQQTEFLLLDEPLAALDVVYQVEVLKLIRQLVDQQGLGWSSSCMISIWQQDFVMNSLR